MDGQPEARSFTDREAPLTVRRLVAEAPLLPWLRDDSERAAAEALLLPRLRDDSERAAAEAILLPEVLEADSWLASAS